MNVTIRIALEPKNAERKIFSSGTFSHHIRETEIKQALADARYNFWKTDVGKGMELGERLYQIGGQVYV